MSRRDPWLPPRTSSRGSGASVSAGTSKNVARTGTPETKLGARKLSPVSGYAVAIADAKRDNQRLATPALAFGSTSSAGRPAQRAPMTAGAEA